MISHDWIFNILRCMQLRALKEVPNHDEVVAYQMLKSQLLFDGRIAEVRQMEKQYIEILQSITAGAI